MLAPSGFPARRLVNQETFEQLLPLAYQWAKTQEELILARAEHLTCVHFTIGPLEEEARQLAREICYTQ